MLPPITQPHLQAVLSTPSDSPIPTPSQVPQSSFHHSLLSKIVYDLQIPLYL
jgi:hypothetical protein